MSHISRSHSISCFWRRFFIACLFFRRYISCFGFISIMQFLAWLFSWSYLQLLACLCYKIFLEAYCCNLSFSAKYGVEPSGCVELASHVKQACPNLIFSGLMTIGMLDYSSTPENFKVIFKWTMAGVFQYIPFHKFSWLCWTSCECRHCRIAGQRCARL